MKMVKNCLLAAVLVLCICLIPAYSEELEWELGTEISHITYKEPGFMKQKGMMYGLTGAYALHEEPFMLKSEGRISWGQVDYSGSGTMENVDDVIFELRGLGGYDLRAFHSLVITPYTGLGYRYLYDDSSGRTTSTGAWGYERESNYFYSPIGVEAFADLGNNWSLAATVEYDLFWRGLQRSHFGSAILENDQDEGYGMRGSVKFRKSGKDLDLVIEPFIRYWDIEDSDIAPVTWAGYVVGYGYEPANHSTEFGCKIALNF